MHLVHHVSEHSYREPSHFEGRGEGLRRAVHVDRTAGAVHAGLGTCALAPEGWIEPHMHGFDELVFVLDGRPRLTIRGRTVELAPHDGALIPVGEAHAWSNAGPEPARWVELQTPPQRDAGDPPDTVFLGRDALSGDEPTELDPADPGLGNFGRLWPPLAGATPSGPRAPGSSAPTMSLPGIVGRHLIDERHGAALGRTFVVEFAPGAKLGGHDHPFEETFYVLAGAIVFEADGIEHELGTGDVAFAGVGCLHAFENRGPEPCLWLESQTPLPPRRNDTRVQALWSGLAGDPISRSCRQPPAAARPSAAPSGRDRS